MPGKINSSSDKTMQRKVWLPVMLVIPLMLGTGCGKEEPTSPGRGGAPARDLPVVDVTIAPVQVETVRRSVEVLGGLFGDEEATISAKVTGRITQILKDVGDRADPYEPLVQIDRTDYVLAVNQAQGALDQALAKLGLSELPSASFDVSTVPTVQKAMLESANAEARFQRAERLFKQTPPLISEQDYADLKTTFDVSRSQAQVALLNARSLVAEAQTRAAELRQQDQRLADATVRTPGDAEITSSAIATTKPALGRYGVSARLISVGEYVQAGTPLFRVVADDPVKFRGNVPERFSGQVLLDGEVRLSVEGQTKPWVGQIKRVNPQIERESRSFLIEAVIPNEDGALRPGAFARGQVGLARQEQATFVPESAVVTFAGVSRIYFPKDGKAVARQVQIGTPLAGRIEIIGGLDGVTEVVTSGVFKLTEGSPLKVMSTTQPTTR